MTPTRVIGAGLSGLSVAWRLADQGVPVEVIEARAEPGGLLGTTQTPFGLAERAANAFVWDDTVARWFATLGLTPVHARDESRRRYLFRDGRPQRWPLSIAETAGMAVRFAGAVITRGTRARGTESVDTWARRVVGPIATEWIVAPALQGIHASPLDQLAAGAVFGHKRRGRVRMAAPSGGMGQFVGRLHERLVGRGVPVTFGRPVSALDPAVPTYVCTSAPAAARLVAPHAPEAARLIGDVRMVSLATVTVFYDPHPGDLHGFGVLFPRSSGVQALGVLFNTDIFEDRGAVRSETWIYGAPAGLGATGLPDDAGLRTSIAADRFRLTGRDSTPLGASSHRWPEALPVYGPPVIEMSRLPGLLPPWLKVTGNFTGRRGVRDLLDAPL